MKFLPLVRFQSEELKAESGSYLLQTGIHPRDCILSVRFDLHYLDLCTSLVESLSRDARQASIVISNLRTNDVAADDCLRDEAPIIPCPP